MPGRKYQASSRYRFNFNGKESDTEYGSIEIQDYGFRMYLPSLARFISMDPLHKEYPELTPYQFASNTPIQAIDLDGLEAHGNPAAKAVLPDLIGGGGGKAAGKIKIKLRLTKTPTKTLSTNKSVSKPVLNNTTKVNKINNTNAKAPTNANTPGKVNTNKTNTGKYTDNSQGAKVHKNNNNYVGNQAVYRIRMDARVQKYGKADASKVSATTGKPVRLQSQINKLQRNNPNVRVEGKVIYQNKNISTRDIKRVETSVIQRHKNTNGEVPSGNRGHPGIK